jgi:exosome complex component RRP43
MASTTNAQIFQRLHPKAYLERFLAERVRPDGREVEEWRDLIVHVGSISTADGSAVVRLGETTIVCGVKAEIAEPDLEQPTDGFLGSYLKLVDMSLEPPNVFSPEY